MPIKDYITGPTNKILIGTGGIGLIITAIVGLSGRTTAYQTRNSSGQNTWGVTIDGTTTQSGSITTKSLISCNTIDSTSTGQLICGTDATGAGGGGQSVDTGALLAVADNRYVNTSGDTMTGKLTIDLTSGAIGLNIVETASGAHVHAEKILTSSGGLVWEGSASGAALWLSDLLGYAVDFDNLKSDDYGVFSCIQGIGCLFDPATVSSSTIADDAVGTAQLDDDSNTPAAGSFVFVETGDVSFDYGSFGQGLTFLNNILTLSAAHSGSVIKASTTLASSGSLVFEGVASGSSLYLGTRLDGAGLASCSNGTTSKLLWNSTTGRFSCGADTDTDTNTTYTAGKGLTLTSTAFSTNATLTGTLVAFQTVSGSVIKALNSLNSSGTLVFEGAASGSSLYIGTSLRGVGLSDCDTAGTSKVLWDTTTGRFSCGTDTDTNTTYTAGQGLTLTSTSFKTNATLTGTTLTFTTISGATLTINGPATSYIMGSLAIGKTTARAGTKLDVVGTISGSLLIGTTLSGNTLKTGLYSASPATVELVITGTGTDIATGSGRIRYVVPKTMSGFKLYDALLTVDTAGTTNTTSIQIRNLMKASRKLFSTVISVDSAEKTSETAATPFVVSTANSDVGGGDYLYVDIPSSSTTKAKGLNLILYFYNPR